MPLRVWQPWSRNEKPYSRTPDMTAQNILVTGASRGIGAVIALELARRGNTVGCLSRKGEGPEGVSIPAELKARLVMLKGDVNNTESMAAALEAFKKATGSISGDRKSTRLNSSH